MLFLQIFSPYRSAGTKVNKKEALKYTSTEQQSCPFSEHSIPTAAVRDVFSWVEAVVYLFAWHASLGGRITWSAGLALSKAKMCMSLSP